MKKFFSKFKLLLILLIICPCFMFFAGCSSGLSAYEIAVKNGFKGTEQEWLASLKGTPGTNGENAEELDLFALYETSKNNGEFDGDFMQFLSKFVTEANVSKAIANQNILSVFEVFSFTSDSILTPSKTGSGVLYSYTDTGAFIVTNAHVSNINSTENYEYFELELYGQDSTKRIPATFVGSSKTYDLAVLYVSNNTPLKNAGSKAVTLANNPAVAGTNVIAIGNTESYGITVTKGIVSVESEEWPIALFSGEETFSYRVLRHDAYISNGSSGGGLFDYYGNLVGITNGGVKNKDSINFAIPASTVKKVVNNIIENCYEKTNTKIQKCVLGIELSITETSTKMVDGIAVVTDTLKLTDITETGAVARANSASLSDTFEINDQIYSIVINGTEHIISRGFVLNEALLEPKAFDTVTLKFIKNGETEISSLDVTFSSSDIVSVV